MEELIAFILQSIGEILIGVLAELPITSGFFKEPENMLKRCFLFFCGGLVFGGLSLFVFPDVFISFLVFRIVNLVLVPFATGFIALILARYKANKDASIVPRNHFWQVFWFTAGFVVVRFFSAMVLQ